MENYIGKICPFCKTEITEDDAVKVCPACGIPHHENCWVENRGCTTFGCSEQNYEAQGTNPTAVCNNCGATLGDGQAFCPKCGAAKDAPKKNICSKCGAELQEDQAFCPKCGQKAGLSVDSDVSSAINQFNVGVEKKKKKSKAVPIVIVSILLIAIAIGAVVYMMMGAKKAEEAKNDYISNAERFLSLSMTAGANLEDIADTIQTYWHENIWDDMHGDDIDTAIFLAMLEKSDEISQAETYDTQLRTLYSKIKSVPEEIAKEDKDDIEELCDAVKDLYNVYTDFYSLATNPTGSYNSYSDNNNETTDDFLSCYRALDNLLD